MLYENRKPLDLNHFCLFGYLRNIIGTYQEIIAFIIRVITIYFCKEPKPTHATMKMI